MKYRHLLVIVSLFGFNSFSQLRKIYFNPEVGLMPHVQASCVAHFKYGISAQAGLNYESFKTGFSSLHYGAFSLKTTSAIKTNYVGGHLLIGASTNFHDLVNAAIFVGTSYGKYVRKYNFQKVDYGSDGYSYQYKEQNIIDFAFMARLDISLQLVKFFGLNFGVGCLMHQYYTSVYGTVGVMVGIVKSREKSTPHPI